MQLEIPVRVATRAALIATLAIGLGVSEDCKAIAVGQLDDFQDGTKMDWLGAMPTNVADAGPAGTGDRALSTTASGLGGPQSMLIIRNFSQWIGDWTAAGVTQVQMDLRNPGNDDLTIRLAIAGPDGFSSGGVGDTYATAGFELLADDQWHHAVFDVIAGDWEYVGGINEDDIGDIPAALAEVTEFRILHNMNPSFTGAAIAASFLVDNIIALGEPAGIDGDYNGNGFVDAADYTLWRDTQGQTGPDLPADGNGDMTVDSADYTYWKERFGNNSGNGAETESGMSFAIPEPAGILLGVMLLLVATMWWWFDLRAATNRR